MKRRVLILKQTLKQFFPCLLSTFSRKKRNIGDGYQRRGEMSLFWNINNPKSFGGKIWMFSFIF